MSTRANFYIGLGDNKKWIGGRFHDAAFAAQAFGQPGADIAVIFDHQNAHINIFRKIFPL